MPTSGGCHPAYQANMQKPECRRFKSCPPDHARMASKARYLPLGIFLKCDMGV